MLITKDVITEKLKISKGNASLNIRELEKLGVVKDTHLNLSKEEKKTQKLYLDYIGISFVNLLVCLTSQLR